MFNPARQHNIEVFRSFWSLRCSAVPKMLKIHALCQNKCVAGVQGYACMYYIYLCTCVCMGVFDDVRVLGCVYKR